MQTNSGLSTKDAQYAICKGTYGNKHWTSEQRQTACKKYEQLTGTKIESGDDSEGNLLVTGVFALIAIFLVGLIVFVIMRWSRSLNKTSHSTKKTHKQ